MQPFSFKNSSRHLLISGELILCLPTLQTLKGTKRQRADRQQCNSRHKTQLTWHCCVAEHTSRETESVCLTSPDKRRPSWAWYCALPGNQTEEKTPLDKVAFLCLNKHHESQSWVQTDLTEIVGNLCWYRGNNFIFVRGGGRMLIHVQENTLFYNLVLSYEFL